MHKYANPARFQRISAKVLPWAVAFTVILFGAGLYFSLLSSPADYQQGETVRIMYVHVPAAWMAMFVYSAMAIGAAVGLVWRHPLAELFTKAVAPVGAAFTAICLATGSLWGEPMWGTWWVWDARLTSMLILLFLYGGVIALDRAINDEKSAARAVSVMVLVGVVNIPIIQYSVEWWNTLHQPSTFKLTEKPSMPAEMWVPLLLSVLGLYLLFGWLACLRMQTEILLREQRTRWVKDYVLAGRV